MTFKVGENGLRYELVEHWEQLPSGMSHPDVTGVATDSEGQVYMFCRGDHPMMIYDRDGHFLDAWGAGQFTKRAHGIYINPEDELYLVDDAAHHVGQYTVDGELIRTIGPSGVASETGYGRRDRTDSAHPYVEQDHAGRTVAHGGPPYNRPTNLTQAPWGDLYVADGYGNSRVHRFGADGNLLESWGEPGSGPGEFRVVHDVAVHPDGRIFVADTQNDRLQIFSQDGEFLDEWVDVQKPRGVFIDSDGLVYVAELVWRKGDVSARRGPIPEEEPSRISIYNAQGDVLLRWGGTDAAKPGNFVAPHGIWVDDEGAIYVAEVTNTIGVKPGYVSAETHTLQKFARV